MPLATPHRAISSEFGIIPCSIRYNTITRKIASRQLKYRPLQFMDSLFPQTTLGNRITSSIDNQYHVLPLIKKNLPILDISLSIDFSGEFSFDCIEDGDLLVFTDGSFKDDVASFGFWIFSGVSWKDNISLYEFSKILTPRKSILDAEAIALTTGLRHSIRMNSTGRIYLLLDNQTALRIFSPRVPRNLQYLHPEIQSILNGNTRPIQPIWIKGHSGNIGNDQADTLAKTATSLFDEFVEPSYSHLNLDISIRSQTEWNDWFDRTKHFYQRRPTRRSLHHWYNSRLDSITLFKLRTNKGWNPGDNIGNQTPPSCICDDTSPKDGAHICQCPVYSRLRPPDILVVEWIHSDKHLVSVIKWIRHHRHFGLKPSTSQVKWINLTKPGNLTRNGTFKCDVCSRDFTSNTYLKLHRSRIHPDGISTSFAWDHSNQCKDCNESFASKRELDNHTSSTHGCKECPFKCKLGGSMKNHMIRKHGGIPCNGCSQRFQSLITLRQHQRSNCGGSRS